uniref:Solute carrier family 39 member 10 n=1 Tax=Sphenodon punctatus TaxID=8508 RepID=A0A8D0HP90_SPHPU
MKVHMHTKFCLICLLTFIFHQCHHCHEDGHDHESKESPIHNHNDYQISEAPYLQNGGTESAPSKEAEHQQKYYIEKLFDHYGENGKLSFFGLEKLLTSLGLGEVKVVEINHEDIGHDHVSHLDVLEVQEGKHSHSHSHPHSHSGSENQTVNSAPTKRNHKCHPEKDTIESSVKPDSKHVHDHFNCYVTCLQCLNVTQLLQYYGLGINSPISPDLFTYLCPALLYQIDRRLCIEHYDDLLTEDLNKEKNTSVENKDKTGASAWICGIISITVISLLSLLGVILIPIINQGCFKFLLTFLVALAVGTLSGDALLHLLPHSQGGHNHSHHENQGHAHEHKHLHGHSHGHKAAAESFEEEYDAVLKGLVALGGIYLLFIIEHCIRMFKHYKQRTKQKWCKKKQKGDESPIGRKLSDHKLNRPDADWLQLKPLAGADDSVLSEDRLNETELTDLDGQLESPPKTFLSVEEENNMHHSHNDVSHVQEHDLHDAEYNDSHGADKIIARKHNHHWHHKHSHHSHGHCHSGKDLKDTGIANIAWMVIMGDGIHNFSDGLAIGAAFSAGLTGGISTSVAVFCHELPHELGDFAVLLKAGMTVKQAIVYNLLSAMMAYVGMLIGTAVGQYANTITLWIFAVTAGMFLYVALVDMLPEMLHGDGDNEEHGYCPVGQFILQNLGLLLGFAIMLVIALYEDKIVFDIQF